MGIAPSAESYSSVLKMVATAITDMCNKELQVNPDDMIVLHSSVQGAAHRGAGAGAGAAAAGLLRRAARQRRGTHDTVQKYNLNYEKI